MNKRQSAIGMFVLAGLFVVALLYNFWLMRNGDSYRPLHILFCGPLAIYSVVKGLLIWHEAEGH